MGFLMGDTIKSSLHINKRGFVVKVNNNKLLSIAFENYKTKKEILFLTSFITGCNALLIEKKYK